MSGDLDLTFQLKIGTPFTRAVGKFMQIMTLYVVFVFELRASIRNRRTDGRTRRVMRL